MTQLIVMSLLWFILGTIFIPAVSEPNLTLILGILIGLAGGLSMFNEISKEIR